jgi:hypothetical protein
MSSLLGTLTKAWRVKISKVKYFFLLAALLLISSARYADGFEVKGGFIYVSEQAALNRNTHLAVKNATAAAEAQASAILVRELYLPNYKNPLTGRAATLLEQELRSRALVAVPVAGIEVVERSVEAGVATVTIRYPHRKYIEARKKMARLSVGQIGSLLRQKNSAKNALLLYELGLLEEQQLFPELGLAMLNAKVLGNNMASLSAGPLLLSGYLTPSEFEAGLSKLSINESLILGGTLSFVEEYRVRYVEFLKDARFKRTAELYQSLKLKRLPEIGGIGDIRKRALAYLDASGLEEVHLIRALVETEHVIDVSGQSIAGARLSQIESSFSRGVDDVASLSELVSELGVSSDMLNYLARVFEAKSLDLSCLLYRVVSESDASHPHAVANLSLTLNKLGYRNAAEEISAKAIKSEMLSGWGRAALKAADLVSDN